MVQHETFTTITNLQIFNYLQSFVSQVKHSIRDMSRGQYQILYYPELATAHKVDIKYNGLTVADSPIVLHAKNPGYVLSKSRFYRII